MPRTRKIRVLSTVLFGTLLVAGCSQTDPYLRSGTWKPSGVNGANIAAQVANPTDLSRGRGEPGGGVRTATGAVETLWKGPVKTEAAPGGLPATMSGGGTQPQAPR